MSHSSLVLPYLLFRCNFYREHGAHTFAGHAENTGFFLDADVEINRDPRAVNAQVSLPAPTPHDRHGQPLFDDWLENQDQYQP